MELEIFQGGFDRNLSYLISSNGEAAIIDAFDANNVFQVLKEKNLTLKYIFSTHNHFDHTEANPALRELTEAKIALFVLPKNKEEIDEEEETAIYDIALKESSEIKIGQSVLCVLHTPGHTPDSICLLADNQFLFTGDTFFAGGIGRIFYNEGQIVYPQTIKRLMSLPEEFLVYPGHNYGKKLPSTIAQEKALNPYIREMLERQ